MFVKLRAGQHDAVIASYHDQGHILVKLLGSEIDPVTGQWGELSGVNITLSLPVKRISVHHGASSKRSLSKLLEVCARMER